MSHRTVAPTFAASHSPDSLGDYLFATQPYSTARFFQDRFLIMAKPVRQKAATCTSGPALLLRKADHSNAPRRSTNGSLSKARPRPNNCSGRAGYSADHKCTVFRDSGAGERLAQQMKPSRSPTGSPRHCSRRRRFPTICRGGSARSGRWSPSRAISS